MRVQLFATCMVSTFFPDTGEATRKLLEYFGVDVVLPAGQTCCGKPPDSAGYTKEVQAAARHFLSVFDGADPIVIPSGSCASMVRNHYPQLFERSDPMFRVAEETAKRTFELSQYLVHVLKAHTAGLRGRGKITYHSSCQLNRELGVKEEPLILLKSLEGAEFVELPHADRCCGFGGTFMAKLPEISMKMADEKAEFVERTGAHTVTGCDHGCLMNIADALRRRNSHVKVKHIAQVLAEEL